MTSSITQPTTISLGQASTFGALATTTVTNTGNSSITGDIGVSPGTSITGFLSIDSGPGTFTGSSYTGSHATAVDAQADAVLAFADGNGRTNGDGSVTGGVYTENTIAGADLTGQDLGGMTLPGGVYYFDTTAESAASTTLTLDWNNDSTSVWIFKIGTTLTTGSGFTVVMTNIPDGEQSVVPVYWIVATSATLGTSSSIVGTIIAAVSITATTSVGTHGLIALDGAVTMDTNTVSSYDRTTTTGADPHIIALDGSRLDVYKPGFYRMFDSNSDERIIINTEIINIVSKQGEITDMYDKFLIVFPDKQRIEICFKDKKINVVKTINEEVIKFSYNDKWEYRYIAANNKYYIIEVEMKEKSFLMRTNDGPSPVKYRGLLTGEITSIESLDDFSIVPGSRSIIPNYYKHNSLLCGSTFPHIVKFNRVQLVLNDKNSTFRLYQDLDILVNVTVDSKKLMRKLMVLQNENVDIYEWKGKEHSDLTMFKNGVEIKSSSYIEEYTTDNLILRVQSNSSVSVSIREIRNMCGLFCGDLYALNDIENINNLLTDDINSIVYPRFKSNSNYSKYMEKC